MEHNGRAGSKLGELEAVDVARRYAPVWLLWVSHVTAYSQYMLDHVE